MYEDEECGPYSTSSVATNALPAKYPSESVGGYYNYQIVHNTALQVKGPMASKDPSNLQVGPSLAREVPTNARKKGSDYLGTYMMM